MNTNINSGAGIHSVEAYRVSEDARIGTLPRHFGRYMMTVEQRIFDQMRELSPDYNGGLWDFFELSNGGFYMAPVRETFRVKVLGNDYEGRMTGNAAGITVCLFAFSLLSFEHQSVGVFGRHFHWLRELALDHAEAGEIFAAID
jgi:hypothetical protein